MDQPALPAVYRYMDRRFVDAFFERGRLRLSSFARFGKHPDEQRLDGAEGVTIFSGRAATKQIVAVTRHGQQALVLCGSTRGDPEMLTTFGCDGAFKIADPAGFMDAIAMVIPGVSAWGVHECIYQEKRVVRRNIEFNENDYVLPDGRRGLTPQKLQKLVFSMAGLEVYLLKHRRYQHQCEFRFLWILDREAPEYLDVECPAAREFCEQIEPGGTFSLLRYAPLDLL